MQVIRNEPVDFKNKKFGDVMKVLEASLQAIVNKKITKAIKAAKAVAYNSKPKNQGNPPSNTKQASKEDGAVKKRGRKPRSKAHVKTQPPAGDNYSDSFHLHSDLDQNDSLVR